MRPMGEVSIANEPRLSDSPKCGNPASELLHIRLSAAGVRSAMQMSEEEIFSEIKKSLSTNPDIGDVTMESNITNDLRLDSLAVMNFVMKIEDDLDVSIPMDRMVEIETVGDLVRTISNLQAARGSR
jgi:acyl carrier protein